MKRTYQKACEWCSAMGFVPTSKQLGSSSTSTTEICPVCNGNKTILVTEEDDITVNKCGLLIT